MLRRFNFLDNLMDLTLSETSNQTDSISDSINNVLFPHNQFIVKTSNKFLKKKTN